MARALDERVKQVTFGAGILVTIAVVVPGTLIGWRYLPGIWGEWVGKMIGVLTTPFFMEASFAVLGIVIVMTLNHWRQVKDGDDFVYLEQIESPNEAANLPDQAKWAVYRDKPLEGRNPTLLEQAEGAFGIGDYPLTAEWIGLMGREELSQPETLALRLALAQATGREDLLENLEAQIQKSKSERGLNV
jgi:hypothetical protein